MPVVRKVDVCPNGVMDSLVMGFAMIINPLDPVRGITVLLKLSSVSTLSSDRLYTAFNWIYWTSMGRYSFWWILRKNVPFFRVATTILGRYYIGGYGRMWVYKTKAHIPLEMGFLRWLPNAIEIYTEKMKCTWPTHDIYVWDPTQPIFH